MDELLAGLEHWAPVPVHPAAFGAWVFKISRDEQETRLIYIKETSGSLKVKTLLESAGSRKRMPCASIRGQNSRPFPRQRQE